MFSKADTKSKRTGRTGTSVPSLLSKDLNLVGNISSEGEIQLDGKVEGDIKCHTLTVGESAQVTGEVDAENIIVHGRVTGTIRAKVVELRRSARVKGDILHETMSIEAGGSLEGLSKRMGEEKTEATVATAAERPATRVISSGPEKTEEPAAPAASAIRQSATARKTVTATGS